MTIASARKPKLPIKYPGGQVYSAARIADWLPPHTHYCEPFFGGGAVLFAKNPEGVSELVNDLDRELTNFWRVLQCEDQFAKFLRTVQAVAFSEAEWNHYTRATPVKLEDPDWRLALSFFVRCRQSLAGRKDSFAAISRVRVRRGMNEQASAWLTAVEGLPAVHERLKRVVILDGRDALDVIRSEDGPQTAFYIDPPYVHSTRATTGEYAHEMTDEQHQALLNLLSGIQGKFILSGYRNPLYDQHAEKAGWHREDWEQPNSAAGGEKKRRMVASAWLNYRPS